MGQEHRCGFIPSIPTFPRAGGDLKALYRHQSAAKGKGITSHPTGVTAYAGADARGAGGRGHVPLFSCAELGSPPGRGEVSRHLVGSATPEKHISPSQKRCNQEQMRRAGSDQLLAFIAEICRTPVSHS